VLDQIKAQLAELREEELQELERPASDLSDDEDLEAPSTAEVKKEPAP